MEISTNKYIVVRLVNDFCVDLCRDFRNNTSFDSILIAQELADKLAVHANKDTTYKVYKAF